jgi:hypothetical protein
MELTELSLLNNTVRENVQSHKVTVKMHIMKQTMALSRLLPAPHTNTPFRSAILKSAKTVT